MTISDYSKTATLLKCLRDRSLKAKKLIARKYYGKPVITKEEQAYVSAMIDTLENLGIVYSTWVSFTESRHGWCYGITDAGRELLAGSTR